MVDRPVLMSAPMVRALLDGRKTQTRRLAWVHHKDSHHEWRRPSIWQSVKPGDRLWVRETWMRNPDFANINKTDFVMYRADLGHDHDGPFKPSIHMPRWANRLTLVVTAAKMERVQEISEKDARAEGVPRLQMDSDGKFYQSDEFGTHYCGFAGIWEHLHAKAGDRWEDNPEIVALTFTVHQRNIDAEAP